MRSLVVCLLFVLWSVDYLQAESNIVYFMTSAEVDFNGDNFEIGDKIPDYNDVILYKASTEDDGLKIALAEKPQMFNTYSDLGVQNVLFYVHGYGKEVEQVYKRALLMQDSYNVKVVFFFWPFMNSKGKPSNLFQSHDNIQKSLPAFNHFIELAHELKEQNDNLSVSLMAHSLGNYFFKLYSLEQNTNRRLIFENVILNSAAVNDKRHGDWLSLLDIQKRKYVLYNNHDFLLKGLQLFTRAKRQLGNKTNRYKISSVNYVNLSEAIGFRFPLYNTHSYFTGEIIDEVSAIKHMYTLIFQGKQIEESDYFALGL